MRIKQTEIYPVAPSDDNFPSGLREGAFHTGTTKEDESEQLQQQERNTWAHHHHHSAVSSFAPSHSSEVLLVEACKASSRLPEFFVFNSSLAPPLGLD